MSSMFIPKKPIAKELGRKNALLSLKMDKLISENNEKRQEILELKASVEEDKTTCLGL